MVNVLLARMTTGQEKLIQLPSDWAPWQIFRFVRENHPAYCFLESWEGSNQPANRLAA